MAKCSKCKAELGPAELRCPVCGTPVGIPFPGIPADEVGHRIADALSRLDRLIADESEAEKLYSKDYAELTVMLPRPEWDALNEISRDEYRHRRRLTELKEKVRTWSAFEFVRR